MRNPLSVVLMAPIRAYQQYVSPGLPRRCRYYPSCSEYSLQAIRVHGPIKGLILGTWRILRCNPWSKGGVDHVPPEGSWKAPEWVPPDDWAGHGINEAVVAARLRGEEVVTDQIPFNPSSARKVEAVSPESVPLGVEDQGEEASPQQKES